ncbi:MAG: ORF6N domain-containing protein [Defluviitaleaceae bacterium]|nr:ORF6N domain-containing protein [Defluviitaleaceae bacterium]
MENLQIVEHKNERVLTTQQIAKAYETDPRRISENFNANKERYVLGKHYYLLKGEELKAFSDLYGNSVVVERTPKLYLWTESGAMRHAKSLNTDKAWAMFDHLVDHYFATKKKAPKEPPKQSIPSRNEIMHKNALTRQAKLLFQMSNVKTLSTEYSNILIAKAAQVITGEEVIPLPKSEIKTLSAYEVGQELGISANKVGRLTNAHNLKNSEYGEWYRDKSQHSSKEVDSFRYYPNIIPVLTEIHEMETLREVQAAIRGRVIDICASNHAVI